MSEEVREIARDVIAEELAVEPDEDGRIHLTETHVRFGAAVVGTAAAGLTLKQLGAIGYAAAQQGPGAGSYGTEAHPLEEIYADTVDRQTDVIDTGALSIDGNELVLDVTASVPNDAQNVRVRPDAIEIADGSNWDPAMAEWYGGSAWGGAVVERYDGNAWTQLYPETAIPDSGDLHSRYDATQLSLSDQDSVTTFADETGNGHDLTAGTAPTYLASGINGNPTVRFDGADDFLDVSFSSISQPVHIFAVIIDQNGGSSSADYLWDGDGAQNAVSWRYAGGQDTQAINAGSDVAVTPTQGTPIITSSLYNGASSVLRTNGGDQSASGDVGSANLSNGFTLGARADESTFGAFDVGEVLIYPEDKSSVQSDVEQYLADKWGITL